MFTWQKAQPVVFMHVYILLNLLALAHQTQLLLSVFSSAGLSGNIQTNDDQAFYI